MKLERTVAPPMRHFEQLDVSELGSRADSFMGEVLSNLAAIIEKLPKKDPERRKYFRVHRAICDARDKLHLIMRECGEH